ncbi:MAG: SDR family NAD(P)-dependent oxidoreductase [Micropruina sp.]|nr:SDR family NAD(P)-dependent oxidoreductase [Micropruina sp.]
MALTALVNVAAPTLRGLLGSPDRLAVVTSDSSDLVRWVTASPAGAALLNEGPLIPVQDRLMPARSRWSSPRLLAVTWRPNSRLRSPPTDTGMARTRSSPWFPALWSSAPGPNLAAARLALLRSPTRWWSGRQPDRHRSLPGNVAERGFIENWEAESYRQSVASSKVSGRLTGKVVMITGAAQGFGLGIAQALITEGAQLILADLNLDGAQANADAMCAEYGAGRAVAIRMDVSDEGSALAAVAEAVAVFGGVDVFVSNAGVLRAGSIFSQPVSDFDLVTNVNYRGYFLGVRAVAPVMAAQHAVRPTEWFDIIEINSESGLGVSGSRPALPARSSGPASGSPSPFALELVECGIKVNAVCGQLPRRPLWMDPERGLFVQYLRAGKVRVR